MHILASKMRTKAAVAIAFAYILIPLFFVSCEDHLTSDSAAKIAFSCDTLVFDTVFTQQGTATRIVMIHNPQKEAINISSVHLNEKSSFRINLDGETDTKKMQDIIIRGGDSLFLFVKAFIDPQDSNSPVLVEDSVVFTVNHNQQKLYLQAYGQDVIILRRDTLFGNKTLGSATTSDTQSKPYLVFDTIIATGNIKIKEGTHFYMHDNATFIFLGGLQVEGTLKKPVVFRGDRLDNILNSIPYDYSSGKWGGIFILQPADVPFNPTYDINYLDVHSAVVGLFCQSDKSSNLPTLKISNSRLHNFSEYGLVVQNMNSEVSNTEISNCANYCLYLSGGKHTFVHNTIANFFNNKKEYVSIHSVSRQDVPAVYISDLSKSQRTQVKFINNIISGWRANNISIATSFPDRYDGQFLGNFMRTDSLSNTLFPNNVYQQDTDTVFVRTYFSREEQSYYDFRLDSVSPARNIADSLSALALPIDRNGNNRLLDGKPDAGCYEWVEQTNAE